MAASAVQEGDAMTCPVCGGKTAVKDSYAECDVVYRERRCVECGYRFTTAEEEKELDFCIRTKRDKRRRMQNERTE